MSLTNDARLVIEAFGPEHERSQVEDAAVRLATAYIEASKVDGGGCPFCGAEICETHALGVYYMCGTAKGGYGQSGYCRLQQIATLTARWAEEQERRSETVAMCEQLSAELADHKRRLMEQSAVLNSVRQERDAYKRRVLNLPE